MEVVNNSFLPGDPRLIDHIVYELKSQGIFDNFRKECIADVDTKPAYQNLRQRVEGSVSGFLKTQKWRSDMNKNHVREMLRKNISESGFLETGVERIVDQVVNPKINSIFLPQVENVVYKVLGIEKPTAFDDLKKQGKIASGNMDLLPNDLEAVSPESEPQEKKSEMGNDSKADDRIDEDESPPFEPLEETMALEENSVDSNLSGISGLVSHDSNHSVENKPVPMETSNQDSQFSKQSSDDRLSIVMSDDQEMKLEINEDSNASIGKPVDSSIKSVDVPDAGLSEKTSNEKSDEHEKYDEKKSDNKKSDKHRSSHKHSSHRSRHDSHKDRKTDRDKREHKSSRTSEDSKDKRDKDKERDKKDRSRSGRDDKSSKNPKERERTSSNSKHKRKESTDDKLRSESKDSKHRERSKDDLKSKSHSSKKIDSKSHSKHNGKTKTDSSESSKRESGKKNDKHKKNDTHGTEKKNDKRKDKKDQKKDGKKEKDDHYSLKEKKGHRRSTDRDSSDGHSGTHSSSSSYTELTTPSQVQKSSQESSLVSGSSSGGDSGNSDTAENLNISSIPCVLSEEEHSQIITSVPHLKLIKPKFASNIFEARRLMKIRRKLGKLEKQKQMELMRVNSLSSIAVNKFNNHMESRQVTEKKDSVDGYKKQRHDILKKRVNNSHVKSYKYEENSISTLDEDNLVEEVQLSEDTELQTSVISKESWDAIEAKLNAQNILKVDYNSYTATTVEKPKVVQKESDCKGFAGDEETKRRADLLVQIIEAQELTVIQMCKVNEPPIHKKTPPFGHDVAHDDVHKLPKIEIVDVTSNNEVVFSPGRGIKRIVSDHDMHNNNKVNKELGDVLSDRLNDLTENHNQSSNPTPKSKKSKLTDPSVNSLDNFNLPLSPAESDKSFNSVGDKKGDLLEGRVRRNRAISNQRYSSDDLYKPRLQFSSKRRRTTKTLEEN